MLETYKLIRGVVVHNSNGGCEYSIIQNAGVRDLVRGLVEGIVGNGTLRESGATEF